MRSLKVAPGMVGKRIPAGRARDRIFQSARAIACLAVLSLVTAAAWSIQQGSGSPDKVPSQPRNLAAPTDANEPVHALDSVQQLVDASGAGRKKIVADEGAELLKLATDLKTEMDKTSKDTLSVGVIRKAEAIEKLAHDVRGRKFVAEGVK